MLDYKKVLLMGYPGIVVKAICGIIAAIVYRNDILIKKEKIILPSFTHRIGKELAQILGINLNPPRRINQARVSNNIIVFYDENG